MSLVKAEEDLKKKGMLDRVIHLAASTATVAEAAEALGVEPGMIAKTLSFLQEEKPGADSDRRNRKQYRQPEIQRYLPYQSQNDSLRGSGNSGRPCRRRLPLRHRRKCQRSLSWTKACGSLKPSTPPPATTHSAVKLTADELEKIAGATGWVDVCK